PRRRRRRNGTAAPPAGSVSSAGSPSYPGAPYPTWTPGRPPCGTPHDPPRPLNLRVPEADPRPVAGHLFPRAQVASLFAGPVHRGGCVYPFRAGCPWVTGILGAWWSAVAYSCSATRGPRAPPHGTPHEDSNPIANAVPAHACWPRFVQQPSITP